MKNCCLIYWGLIRGFKYDYVYESHKKKIYNYLEKNDINYDIYIVTNETDYDDTQIKKLDNVKNIIILNTRDINKSELYNNMLKNFNFHSHFIDESKVFLAYCYYNRKYIMNIIPDNYDFYISLDIQHYIENFEFLDLLNKDNAVLSNYHKQLGVNPRVFISNYKFTKIYNNISDYALLGNYHHNPESLLHSYLKLNNIPIVETDKILIHRVRTNGTLLRDNL